MTLPIPDIITVSVIIGSLVALAGVFTLVVYLVGTAIRDAIGRGLNL